MDVIYKFCASLQVSSNSPFIDFLRVLYRILHCITASARCKQNYLTNLSHISFNNRMYIRVECVIIYLLKRRYLMMNNKVANRIGLGMLIVSIILFIGLAGSLELDTITLTEFLMLGTLYVALGAIGVWIVQMTGFKRVN